MTDVGDHWVVFDTFRQETCDPLDIGRPVMPLAETRRLTREVAIRACARLNRAYVEYRARIRAQKRLQLAMLQRHEFDAPRSHHKLFGWPFAAKLVLPRRPRWAEGDKASPRFPYAWYLWDWRHVGEPVLRFLPEPGAGGAR